MSAPRPAPSRPTARVAPAARLARVATLASALATTLAAALVAPTRLAAQARPAVPGSRPAARVSDTEARARVEAALRAQPIVDGHNDLPWAIREAVEDAGRPGLPDVAGYDLRRRTPGQTDFARLAAGRVGVQFWSVYIPGEPDAAAYAPNGRVTGTPGYARVQLEQLDVARQLVARYPDRLALAGTAAEAEAAVRAGRIASLFGMEGGHAIENSLATLRTFHALGARYLTLTHNVTLDWADAALDAPRHGGLSPFGEEVVREMNRLGMLVDLSHVSDATMSDALRVSEAPVIFSHSSARAVNDHRRNVPDSILAKLPANGGVVMVTFVGAFVSPRVRAFQAERARAVGELRRAAANPEAGRRAVQAWDAAHPAVRATVAEVADHVEHVRRVAGVDHVGLGGDFDGATDMPVGLEDVSGYPALLVELARRGWREGELRKVAGENALRALRQAEEVARRLQQTRGPSTRTIQELDGAPAGR